MIDLSRYQVQEGKSLSLQSYSTKKEKGLDKNQVKDVWMPENIEKLSNLQEKLYAENTRALLVVFQAMDAAGKDGAIKHVMTGLNLQGVFVSSFKVPSSEENDHDYLWRVHQRAPRRGEIGVFNRSHYEDVLVSRVHDLLENSQMPKDRLHSGIWATRYRQIRDYEQYLWENGVETVKFFLHVSKDEQRERLLERINNPEKNWKFSSSDIAERKYWDKYMEAYEDMLLSTSTARCPWYVLPADNKWFTRYLVSEVLVRKLEAMNPQFPKLRENELSKIDECRLILEQDGQ
jgi:PPK2 family polyphosphate:nucleotide phosphotransferase